MSVPTAGDVSALIERSCAIEVVVGDGTRIGPWSVARFAVVDGPWTSIIVKWLRKGDPAIDGDRAHPSQLITERLALEHLQDLGIAAPRVTGYSGPVRSQVLNTARAIGERHAATSGGSSDYYSRFPGWHSADPDREHRRFLGRGWERTSGWAADLGVPPSSAVVREVREVAATLTAPGALLAMSNGDSATNNVMVDRRSSIVIDYEFAGFRHCLTDLVDFYLPGPRFVTVPDAVASGFEDAYRSAASAGIPAVADDDRYGHDLAAASLTHAFTRLANFDRIDRRPAGDPSRLERRHGLERAADLAESRDSFGHLVDWCRSVARLLGRRWPDTEVATADLPVFLPRT